MSNKKYFDMNPTGHRQKISIITENNNFADLLQKLYTKQLISHIKTSTSPTFIIPQEKVLYRSKRWRVTGVNSKIRIYDKKFPGHTYSLADLKLYPKAFGKAMIARMPFFEVYEKTQ